MKRKPSGGKAASHRPSKKVASAQPSINTRTHPDAAGIDAILAGERDPKKLAALRDKRCRRSAEEITEALRGDYREEYLFVLAQSQRTYR